MPSFLGTASLRQPSAISTRRRDDKKKKRGKKSSICFSSFWLCLALKKTSITQKKKKTEARERKKAGEKKKKKRDFICIWWTKSCVAFLVAWLTRATIFVNYYHSFFFFLCELPSRKNRICSYNNASKRSLLIVFFSFFSKCVALLHIQTCRSKIDEWWFSLVVTFLGAEKPYIRKKKKLLLIFNRVWNHIKFTDKIEETLKKKKRGK